MWKIRNWRARDHRFWFIDIVLSIPVGRSTRRDVPNYSDMFRLFLLFALAEDMKRRQDHLTATTRPAVVPLIWGWDKHPEDPMFFPVILMLSPFGAEGIGFSPPWQGNMLQGDAAEGRLSVPPIGKMICQWWVEATGDGLR